MVQRMKKLANLWRSRSELPAPKMSRMAFLRPSRSEPVGQMLQNMASVWPSEIEPCIVFPSFSSPSVESLTVWTKSLVFNGHGYTVYDCEGRMVFRVENYCNSRDHPVFLMDSAGNVLLTIRRKKLSLLESWEAYRGDTLGSRKMQEKPLFRATKALLSSHLSTGEIDGSINFRLSSSREKGWSKIHCNSGALVAEVKRKHAGVGDVWLGEDVLNLKIQPGMDQAIVMALFIIHHAI